MNMHGPLLMIRRLLLPVLALAVLLCDTRARAADAAARTMVGKCISHSASLLRREADGKPWKPVTEKEDLYSGDLLLAVPNAVIELKSGVRLELQADIEGRGPYPIIESAVVLREPAKADLDFVLDRGRVTVMTPKGTCATVHVRFHGEEWDLHLKPDARVALETFGRWPKGSVFTKTPTKKDVPTRDMIAIVLQGEMILDSEAHDYRMQAPPGPAFFQWDSELGYDATPRRMSKLPAWAEPIDPNTPEAQKAKARRDRFHQLVMTKSVDAAIDDFLHSDDPNCRRGAIYLIAAMDDLERLGNVVMHTKHQDVWDHGVLALRHWLGRCPGQDLKFYDMLVKKRDCSPAHAETIISLTRSFSDHDLAGPECYEMLIEYLLHDKQAIRGLAHWHLHRLVPEGRKIKYSALDTKEERSEAHKEWKKLIPDGKLPPHPKKSEE